MKKLFIAAMVLGFIGTSCGSSAGSDASAQLEKSKARIAELESAASSTTKAPETTAAPRSTTTQSTTPPTTAAPTTAAPTTVPPTTKAPVSRALMPDVVCMNLQVAQDFIQSETGVFLSLSEDATGAGRSQIIDSNWIVVAQRPDVGTPIGEGDAVLSAVKLDEPNNC